MTIREALSNAIDAAVPMTRQQKNDADNRVKDRTDAFINAISGLRTGHDRTTYTQWQVGASIYRPELWLDLFRNNDVARRAVTIRPYEAMRQGYTVELTDGTPEEHERLSEALAPHEDDTAHLHVNSDVKKAAVWGGLYGGGIIFVGCDDGRKPEEPLNEEGINAINFLNPVDRRWLVPLDKVMDPMHPRYGEPLYYGISNSSIQVHWTRCVRFGGALTPPDMYWNNGGWDDSILQVVLEVLQDYDAGYHGTSIMLSEATQAVIKLKSLIELIAGDDGERLTKRMKLVQACRGIARALVLDSEESFERHEISFSGVGTVLDRVMMRLAQALEIPVTVLMGRSPQGMNATGDSDFRQFYDTIGTYRTQYLEPKLRRIITLLLRSKAGPTNGQYKPYKIRWANLWQPTDLEKAQAYAAAATADAAYIDRGVLLPEEVALSRFKPEGFDWTIEIDREARLIALTMGDTEPKVSKSLVTPTDVAKIVTVNEARAAEGLPALGDERGSMTVNELATSLAPAPVAPASPEPIPVPQLPNRK